MSVASLPLFAIPIALFQVWAAFFEIQSLLFASFYSIFRRRLFLFAAFALLQAVLLSFSAGQMDFPGPRQPGFLLFFVFICCHLYSAPK